MITNLTSTTHIDTVSVNASVNSSIGSFSLNFTIRENLPLLFTIIEIKLQTTQRNVYDLVVLNRTLDFCCFFENPLSEPLINIVYAAISSRGHIPSKCPIEKVSSTY